MAAATKDLIKEANCNVCHIAGPDKKKRNPYGQAVGKQLKETKFDLKAFKDEPNKYTDKLKKSSRRSAKKRQARRTRPSLRA